MNKLGMNNLRFRPKNKTVSGIERGGLRRFNCTLSSIHEDKK